MIRMTSELETNLVSVERVREYSETQTEVIHQRGYQSYFTLHKPLSTNVALVPIRVTPFSPYFALFQAERIIPESRPSRDWPEQGVVKFDNFQLRYRDGLPLVLKGISVIIKPAEKVYHPMLQIPTIFSFCFRTTTCWSYLFDFNTKLKNNFTNNL